MFSQEQIRHLLNQQSITPSWPWETNDPKTIEKHVKGTVAELRRAHRVSDRTVYDHYGSGYASYIDCWLYRKNADFSFDWESGEEKEVDEHCYWGLVILFSRLTNYFVIGQGQRSWCPGKGSGAYLPEFLFVDQIDHPAVLELVNPVCKRLEEKEFIRLTKDDLCEFLPHDTCVPTILCERAFREFDALFYWED